jgi:hypothetical protein
MPIIVWARTGHTAPLSRSLARSAADSALLSGIQGMA